MISRPVWLNALWLNSIGLKRRFQHSLCHKQERHSCLYRTIAEISLFLTSAAVYLVQRAVSEAILEITLAMIDSVP
jgi:hypothetical protein